MRKIELQRQIFNEKLRRSSLLGHQKTTTEPKYNVLVLRNHAFEMVQSVMPLFLDYAGFELEFELSDYDDSLNFKKKYSNIDLILLWIDTDNYNAGTAKPFLTERLETLKSVFDGPILFAGLSQCENISLDMDGVEEFDFSKTRDKSCDTFYDLDKAKIAGTNLSATALREISKDLALNYFPSLLKPSLKCIVTDLDYTLYDGVLGEDGIHGVTLTEGHLALQRKLLDLKENGFIICVASKNELVDVQELFSKRSDFPLKASDFTFIHASWGAKSEAIASIIEKLNIHQSAVLFVDDNYGELIQVHNMLPELHMILAQETGEKTLEVINNFPGLKKLHRTKEDEVRSNDILANEQRIRARTVMSEEEYLKSLDVRLHFQVNEKSTLKRFCELSNKTNQFIFNYGRFREAEINRIVNQSDVAIVTVSLSDKLSDSGIIGGLLLKNIGGGIASVEECFVSCRALGRGLDASIVLGGIKLALEHFGLERFVVKTQIGERNRPALNFIEEHLKEYTHDATTLEYDFPAYLNISLGERGL